MTTLKEIDNHCREKKQEARNPVPALFWTKFGKILQILTNTPEVQKFWKIRREKILNILKNISDDKTKKVLFYLFTGTLEKYSRFGNYY